jgi:breast cancer 2 susceptibility protein
MKSRYEIELCSAKRPSVRKILNRDVSAGGPIVLCVSQILRFATKKKGQESGKNAFTEEIRLELTDGWYGIPAVIDSILQTFVTNAKIRVGSKLIVCNAQVSGSDDGVDPLDESYSPDKRNCPLFLKISANNTRLARWDAKLGFASPKCGGISVKSLRDIYPGGGNIPAIDLVICKRYPKMFLEQMTTGGNKRATHLTEAEEVTRQNEFDLKHQRTGEKHVDTAHNECAKVSHLSLSEFFNSMLPLA